MAPVHPHVCGEHFPANGVQGVPVRFIPTCVGNTFQQESKWAGASVHPHVCGEHKIAVGVITIKYGSSPRVWGTRPTLEHVGELFRFIPTCVGNTHGQDYLIKAQSVHPHVCGEHLTACLLLIIVSGSSPRVWGTLLVPPVLKGPARFIPTCVGNTMRRVPTIQVHPVHPHVCGEHMDKHELREMLRGSSPRVWGTRPENPGTPSQSRFIPTCVGNTTKNLTGKAREAVHPHVCGEHMDSRCSSSALRGSSPRVWGTPTLSLFSR